MSYNIQKSGLVSDVLSQLPRIVTDALKTASADEADDVKLAGQIAHVKLSGAEQDALVDLQAYGSDVPSTGNSVLHLNITVRRLKERAEPTEPEKIWTPADGPLAVGDSTKAQGYKNSNGE